MISDDETGWMSDLVLRDSPGPNVTERRGDHERAIKAAIAAQDEASIQSIVGMTEATPTPAELLPMFDILDSVERQVGARLMSLTPQNLHHYKNTISLTNYLD